MNKIYVFCFDDDMTMRSSPQPIKAFLSKEAAHKFGVENNYIKETDDEKNWWQLPWKIITLEFQNE